MQSKSRGCTSESVACLNVICSQIHARTSNRAAGDGGPGVGAVGCWSSTSCFARAVAPRRCHQRRCRLSLCWVGNRVSSVCVCTYLGSRDYEQQGLRLSRQLCLKVPYPKRETSGRAHGERLQSSVIVPAGARPAAWGFPRPLRADEGRR